MLESRSGSYKKSPSSVVFSRTDNEYADGKRALKLKYDKERGKVVLTEMVVGVGIGQTLKKETMSILMHLNTNLLS